MGKAGAHNKHAWWLKTGSIPLCLAPRPPPPTNSMLPSFIAQCNSYTIEKGPQSPFSMVIQYKVEGYKTVLLYVHAINTNGTCNMQTYGAWP